MRAIIDTHIHHNDPFDRPIISQTLVGKVGSVSVDEIFDQYDVSLVRYLRWPISLMMF